MVSVLSAYVEQVIQINNKRKHWYSVFGIADVIYHGQTVPTSGPAPNVAGRDHNRTLVSGGVIFWLTGVGVASFGTVKDLITRHAVVHGEARKIVDGSVLGEANLLAHKHLLSKSNRECDIFSRGAHCLSSITSHTNHVVLPCTSRILKTMKLPISYG